MPITVYGASDDLIEVDGDISGTFRHTNGEHPSLLTFSDGTVLAMRSDPEYAWVIDVLAYGTGETETWTHLTEGDQARVHGATSVAHSTGSRTNTR